MSDDLCLANIRAKLQPRCQAGWVQPPDSWHSCRHGAARGTSALPCTELFCTLRPRLASAGAARGFRNLPGTNPSTHATAAGQRNTRAPAHGRDTLGGQLWVSSSDLWKSSRRSPGQMMLCQRCSTSPQSLPPPLSPLVASAPFVAFTAAVLPRRQPQDRGQSASLQSHHNHKLAFSCLLWSNTNHGSEGASQTTSHPLHGCLWVPPPPQTLKPAVKYTIKIFVILKTP